MPLLRKKAEDKLSDDFLQKINAGRENLQSSAPARDEAWEFYRGNHFAYLNQRGQLDFRPDGSIGVFKPGKPAHRARQARNFIFDVVLREQSNATQQVPSYQVVASSTTDLQKVAAAELSEKILLYGYDRWGVRKATIDAVAHAIIGGEAFAWVYFDTTIGPFVSDDEGSVGQGDVRIKVYGGNECYWEPGVRFEDSPWHCVEQAVPPSQVEQMPGYLLPKGKLTCDANTRAFSPKKGQKGKLVLVTHYLERPSPQEPEGKWITLANQRKIVADRPYPGDGESPVLRQLVYAPDPDNDRDLGLVPQLLDAQRTKNDSENKSVEWKNHALFPQWIAAPGLLKKQRRTDEPGKVYEVPDPDRNIKILDPPPIPEGLFRMADRATDDLLRIAGQQDVPPNVEAARAITALIEKNKARSGMFIASLAAFHSQVGHDALVQVQQNYTEPRLIRVKGDFGWESIEDFKGAHLMDQNDVRVYPDSIAPQTREEREQRIMNYVQMQAVDPVAAMTAIETGSTEGLIRSVAQDQARVGRIIQRLKEGPESLAQMPDLPTGRLAPIIDPTTGQPLVDPMTGQVQRGGAPEMAPGWMPRYSDNLGLFRTIFEDWLKSEEYERLGSDVQQAASQIYAGVLQLEAEKAAEAQAAQNAQAEALGMQNAARPQGTKPNPSLPKTNGNGAK